jgi:hypothetical protein
MAADKPRDPRDEKDRPQDPLVERLRPDPAQPAEPTKTLSGLLGDSDRPGHRRLYFTAELDYYAEFRGEDVLAYADLPPDQPPFLGEQATRVTLRRDATVAFTRTQQAEAAVAPLPPSVPCPSMTPVTCPSQVVICPSQRIICRRSQVVICRSQPIITCQANPSLAPCPSLACGNNPAPASGAAAFEAYDPYGYDPYGSDY